MKKLVKPIIEKSEVEKMYESLSECCQSRTDIRAILSNEADDEDEILF